MPCNDANLSFKQHSQCLLLLGGVADLCKYAVDKDVFFLKGQLFHRMCFSAVDTLATDSFLQNNSPVCMLGPQFAPHVLWGASLHPICSGGAVCTPCPQGERERGWGACSLPVNGVMQCKWCNVMGRAEKEGGGGFQPPPPPPPRYETLTVCTVIGTTKCRDGATTWYRKIFTRGTFLPISPAGSSGKTFTGKNFVGYNFDP